MCFDDEEGKREARKYGARFGWNGVGHGGAASK
jgi:hypothetical protein